MSFYSSIGFVGRGFLSPAWARLSSVKFFALLAFTVAGFASAALPGSAFGGVVFSPAVNFGADTRPISVATADFNGDAFKDMAVANWGSNNVSVLLSSALAVVDPGSLTFGSMVAPVPQGGASAP